MTQAVPGHLAVYLSNACNLACSYCYVAVNQSPAARLDWPALRAGIDSFLDSSPPDPRVTFLGGEPLLDFPLLRRAVLHLRSRAPGIHLAVFTNGTLLDAPKASFLLDRGVRVVVSLDGRPETNDAERRFAGAGGSAFAAAARRLRGLPVERLEVNMVVVPERAAGLPEDVLFLASLGFRSFGFYPALYGRWTPAATVRLRRALGALRRRLREAPAIELRDVALAERRAGDPAWWRSCGNLVLGGDGRFYACDKALSLPFDRARALATGSTGDGVDRPGRLAQHASAAAEVDRRAPGKSFLYCPMGTVFHDRLTGRRTSSLPAFARVNDALSDFYAGRPL